MNMLYESYTGRAKVWCKPQRKFYRKHQCCPDIPVLIRLSSIQLGTVWYKWTIILEDLVIAVVILGSRYSCTLDGCDLSEVKQSCDVDTTWTNMFDDTIHSVCMHVNTHHQELWSNFRRNPIRCLGVLRWMVINDRLQYYGQRRTDNLQQMCIRCGIASTPADSMNTTMANFCYRSGVNAQRFRPNLDFFAGQTCIQCPTFENRSVKQKFIV